MSQARKIIAQAIATHGGVEHWTSLTKIEAILSIKGFLFTAKQVQPLENARVQASLTSPGITLHDWPQRGLRGEWLGAHEVRIVADDGRILEQRSNPRAAFCGLRRQLWWDKLDFLYFAGYALWNYLTTPFLFLRSDFEFESLAPGADNLARVAIRFPPDVATHCREQIFHFAENGELRRHDYTAEVVGWWARAAHVCEAYREFSGLRVPTKRRVKPLFNLSKPLPFPTLVAIDIHDLKGC